MTDLEKLRGVFKELGIKYEVGISKDKSYYLSIDEGKGYVDFWCEFDFDKDEKFESHSVCEG